MKNRQLISFFEKFFIFVFTLLLILSGGLTLSHSYFSDTIRLKTAMNLVTISDAEITMLDDNSTLCVENIGSITCFVRIKAYSATGDILLLQGNEEWSYCEDGFLYCLNPISPFLTVEYLVQDDTEIFVADVDTTAAIFSDDYIVEPLDWVLPEGALT